MNIEKVLLNHQKYKEASKADILVPHEPGIYCFRLRNIEALPSPYKEYLKIRKHNLFYIGIATKNLNRRMLNQELRAKGHGTFFRSLGAVLGYRPKRGSLIHKLNKRNYKFEPEDELRIMEWVNDNLLVHWVVHNSDLNDLETSLIRKYKPLLNLSKNPLALAELKAVRSECVRIANDKVE